MAELLPRSLCQPAPRSGTRQRAVEKRALKYVDTQQSWAESAADRCAVAARADRGGRFYCRAARFVRCPWRSDETLPPLGSVSRHIWKHGNVSIFVVILPLASSPPMVLLNLDRASGTGIEIHRRFEVVKGFD